MPSVKKLKICREGHEYYKSSDCPTCPVCEEEKRPVDGFLALLAAPARRALVAAGITTLHQLSKKTEEDLLKLHGMGPSSIPKLKAALKEKKLSLKNR
jgi:DNA-directed RNA polymerase alpha subunit